ncbi:MAG: zinc ABC transporter ATPase [Clostridium sp. 27_14]|nr:MAG: zinc ABC transporter ATPase [Clostridium sp. 27_14]
MKKQIIQIVSAFILFIIALCAKFENIWINRAIYLIGYLIVGGEIILKAIKNIFKRELFDEHFLMAVATIGAIAIGEYPEAVAVMLFYQVGELFQDYAVDKSKKSITELMNIRTDYANVKRNENITKVNPEKVKIGEIIVVKPGEKIPLDGIVLEGKSMIDTSSLTGESLPRNVEKNDEILSGCINQNGTLSIKVTKEYGESTVHKILDLVENASNKKSKSENFITKFAKYYTPIVVILAILLAIVPPFILRLGEFTNWLYRALTFLVVSCPCALVISIPLGFFGGIGGASKKGILVKGSNYLEALANTETVIFDKTGTLTEGIFEVQKIETVKTLKQSNKIEKDKKFEKNNKTENDKDFYEIEKQELLKLVASCEKDSNHPIAMSVKKAYAEQNNQKMDGNKIKNINELAGKGISAIIDEKEILVGNEKLMKENSINYIESKDVGTVLYVSINKKFAGYIVISDKIKHDSKTAISDLYKNGVNKTIMLTGDKKEVAENVSNQLGITSVFSELLPDGKVEKVEEIIKNKSPKSKVVFVGDGINDAPVLALSDIGIAMGGLGSDAAIEAADVVIMTDEPSKVSQSIDIAKKTMKIVKENIIFAIAIKIIVLILGACGGATMWEAVFADVGVSILAIINSLRMLK